METIYKLEEKFAAISEAYDQLEAQLVETYEENGGEVTDVPKRSRRFLKPN